MNQTEFSIFVIVSNIHKFVHCLLYISKSSLFLVKTHVEKTFSNPTLQQLTLIHDYDMVLPVLKMSYLVHKDSTLQGLGEVIGKQPYNPILFFIISFEEVDSHTRTHDQSILGKDTYHRTKAQPLFPCLAFSKLKNN